VIYYFKPLETSSIEEPVARQQGAEVADATARISKCTLHAAREVARYRAELRPARVAVIKLLAFRSH